MKNKTLKIIFAAIAIVLCIPLIAMQFTDQVSWTVFDFAIMGTLLFGACFLGVLTTKKVAKKDHKVLVYIAILASFLLIWAELAVGIFGSPFAGS